MNRHDAIRDAMNENLSGLTLSRQQQYEMIKEITGGKKVKKKLSAGLVLAMVLILASAAALAWGLTYSPRVSADLAALGAVMAKYGLAREAMDMFVSRIEEKDDGTVVRFTDPSEFEGIGEKMGEYTVTIQKDGTAQAVWSNDDIDKAVWSGEDLSAAAWGNAQILAYRAKREQEQKDFQAEWEALYGENGTEKYVQPEATPLPAGKLTYKQAIEAANGALKDTFGLTDDMLSLFAADGAVGEVGFGKYDDGVWCFVYSPTMEAGEILQVNGDSLLGRYTALLLDETGEILDVKWDLAGVETGSFTEATFGQAKALDAKLLPYALKLVKDVAPIREKNADNPGAWSVEDSAAYDLLMRNAGFDAKYYNHVLPQKGDISYEDAVNIAAQVLEKEYGVSRALFDQSNFAYNDLTDEGDHREWYFWVQNSQAQCGWTVQMNAQTGEILYIGTDPWAQSNG